MHGPRLACPRLLLAALIAALIAAVLALPAAAADKGKTDKKPAAPKAGEAKVVSGMSIVGNNETPKSLYIVPWKSSEIGTDTDLNAGLLNDAMAPVDKEVFMREMQFYELTNGK